MQQKIKEAKELTERLHEIISNIEEKSGTAKRIKSMEAVFSEMIKEQESDRLLIESLMNEIKEKNDKINHYKKVFKRISVTIRDMNDCYKVPEINKKTMEV